MNIVRMSAGLGNQMFQYAFYRALQETNGNAKMDISEFRYRKHHNGYELEKLFHILPDYATRKESDAMVDMSKSLWADIRRNILKIKHKGAGIEVGESDAGTFHPELLSHTNAYFTGFWQTEKYFLPIADKIRQEFTFKDAPKGENQRIVDDIVGHNAVSIHVRCGDYLKKRRVASIGSVCTRTYYQNAIQYLQSRFNDVRFFVFSDDMEYARNHLQLSDAVYVNINHGADSYKDMQLMSLCRHNIIANSSFSWWGAWLNTDIDKIVLAPEVWFRGSLMPDIVPDSWTKTGIDG